MMPNADAVNSPATPSAEPPRVALLRLRLKPDVPTEASVDGAWWPRSMDLAAELPALISSLWERLGQAVLVVFDQDAWDDLPRSLEIGEQAIRLEGADSEMPDRLTVVGSDGRRLTLLVVSPDASALSATQTLREAASPTSESSTLADEEASRTLDEVAHLLARHEGASDARRTAQISRWVRQTADSFGDAPIQSFVPILVEHIVRLRMAATGVAG